MQSKENNERKRGQKWRSDRRIRRERERKWKKWSLEKWLKSKIGPVFIAFLSNYATLSLSLSCSLTSPYLTSSLFLSSSRLIFSRHHPHHRLSPSLVFHLPLPLDHSPSLSPFIHFFIIRSSSLSHLPLDGKVSERERGRGREPPSSFVEPWKIIIHRFSLESFFILSFSSLFFFGSFFKWSTFLSWRYHLFEVRKMASSYFALLPFSLSIFPLLLPTPHSHSMDCLFHHPPPHVQT